MKNTYSVKDVEKAIKALERGDSSLMEKIKGKAANDLGKGVARYHSKGCGKKGGNKRIMVHPKR